MSNIQVRFDPIPELPIDDSKPTENEQKLLKHLHVSPQHRAKLLLEKYKLPLLATILAVALQLPFIQNMGSKTAEPVKIDYMMVLAKSMAVFIVMVLITKYA